MAKISLVSPPGFSLRKRDSSRTPRCISPLEPFNFSRVTTPPTQVANSWKEALPSPKGLQAPGTKSESQPG